MKRKRMIVLYLVVSLIFAVTFYFGVFANPNFNIHDFCMNLASEIIGLVIALVFVDNYIRMKEKAAQEKKKEESADKP